MIRRAKFVILSREDAEYAGAERFRLQTEAERAAALKSMVEDAGIRLDNCDPARIPSLSERRSFARGWLDEQRRQRKR